MLESPRRNLSQVICDDILRQIRVGEIRVGDRLPTQQDLMREYGVGHSVVRDAMQQLTAIGIVDVRPRRGATVLSVDSSRVLDNQTLAALLSDQAVDDLYGLRQVIEVAIAGQAAERATPAEIAEIERLHRRFGEAYAAGLPVYQIDLDFHQALATASQNLVYARVLEALSDVMAAVRDQARRVPGASADAYEQHGEVLEAVRAGDADAARAAMARHIETATRVVEEMRRLPEASDDDTGPIDEEEL